MFLEGQNLKQENNNKYLDYCIQAIANNDKRYLEELYVLTAKSIYGYALSILKNKYDAEDVLQSTYINIFKAAKSYQSKGKPKAWMMRIAKNLCLEKIRKHQYEVEDVQEDWNTVVGDNDELSVTEKLLVQKCMTVLSEEEREIVILHAVSGLKHREIAENLGLLLPTVLSKYNRAIKKLKDEYLKEINDEK